MAAPTLGAWLPAAKEANPNVPEESLTAYWEQKYGPAPSSLPSLQTWLPDARKANPNVSDTDLRAYWETKYGAHGAPEKESTEGDAARGFKDTFKQLPQLGYGLVAGAGATAESVLGEGGLATGMKKFGVEKFQEKSKEIAAHSKPSDSFNYAYDQASQGNFGALVDWMQYGLGYAGGQGLQTLATIPIGGAVGKAALQPIALNAAERLVAKEVARLGTTDAAKTMGAEELKRLATANVAANIGKTVTLGAQAVGMEGGEIFGDLASQSVGEHRALSGEELAKAFGASIGAGALEFVGDKVGLDLVLGKSPIGKFAGSAPGASGRLARAGVAGTAGAATEGATEFAQTLIEEVGKGKDPLSDASMRQAIDAAALGAVGGGAMGGTGGMLSRAQQPPLALPTPTPETIDIEATPSAIGVGNPQIGVDEAIAAATSILEAPVGSDRKKAADLSTRLATRMEVQGGRLPTAQEAAMLSGAIPQTRPEIPILPGAPAAPAPEGIQIVSPPSKPPVSLDDPRAAIAEERKRLLAMKESQPPKASIPTPNSELDENVNSNISPDAPLRSALDLAYTSTADINRLAQERGVAPGVIQAMVQQSTGKADLASLTPAERDRFNTALENMPLVAPASKPVRKLTEPVASPAQPAATEPVAPVEMTTRPRSELIPEQSTEMLLRAEKAQADLEIGTDDGPSLTDFIKSHGGLQDQGGELSHLGLDQDRKPFAKKLAQEGGLSLDRAAELAHESGYIPERDINLLLEKLADESRGHGSQSPGWYKDLVSGSNPLIRGDKKKSAKEKIAEAIAKIIKDDGVDVGSAVEKVKAAILADREFHGTEWGRDLQSVLEGDWPSWIPKPEGIEAPQAPAAPEAPSLEVPTQVQKEKAKLAEMQAAGAPSDIASGAMSIPPPRIDIAAHEAAPSPLNDRPEPTDAQKEAGNYKKGHIRINGLDISIENPQGATRSGKDANGKPWSIEMQSHYGYIKGTKGKDKEHIDVFVKPGTPEDYSGPVFVIDQKKPSGHFDEHKVVLGAGSQAEAEQLYKENYSKDWDGIRSVGTFESMDAFKGWLHSGDTTKPTGVKPSVQAERDKLEAMKKPGQQEIPVPPPTIGERPIIAPEAPLSETPLFSKGAQEPEPEQDGLFTDKSATFVPELLNPGEAVERLHLPSSPFSARDVYRQALKAAIQQGRPVNASAMAIHDDIRREAVAAGYHPVAGSDRWEKMAAMPEDRPAESAISLPDDTSSTVVPVTDKHEKLAGRKYKGYASTNEGGFLSVDAYGDTADEARTNVRRLLAQKLKERAEKRGEKPKKDATPEPATTNDKTAAASKLADFVMKALAAKQTIDDAQFFEMADFYFGGTRASSAYAQKEAYDALELGVNRFLLRHAKEGVPDGTFDGSATLIKARLGVQDIRTRILERIPTQKPNRTEDQSEFQQFSTPPDLAYVMNWAAKVTSADTMLEPSAGIGGIAVFAKLAGARVVMNEYHGPRADVLRQLDIGPVYQENAEQLNNILPDTTRPTVIVMNPPFSSTAGRKQGERSSRNVLRHLDQALARLEPGGRLVALIGQGRDGKDAQFLEEWKRLTGMKYAYRGRIGLSGDGYKKYGTTYNNQILIFDKIKPDGRAPVNANVADVFEALPLLSEVRDARTAPARHSQSAPAQSGSETLAQDGGRRDGSQSAVSPAAPTVGPRGERSGPDAGQSPRAESAAAADRGESPEQPGQGGGAVVSPARPGGASQRPAAPEPAQSGERPEPGGRRDTSPGQPERSGERGPDAGPGLSDRLTVEQEDAPAPESPVDRTESDDSIFESYTPKKVRIKGAQPHPGKLVESAAMAAIDPPSATYKPSLPKDVIEEGRLSGAQLEPIVYAGQAHEQLLPDGSRRGFFDGDGTGVGKGREIAGIIFDNLRQGHKKAVWMSKNSDLFSSAVRDWRAVSGTDGKELFSQGDMDLGETVTRKTGIMFSNYLLLGDGLDLSVDGKLEMKKHKEGAVDRKGNLKKPPTQTRLDQMVKWLGPDFDGVIVFDEAHEMRNNMQTSGARGDKKPAMKALAGIELQKRFPKARIAYFSATGGIEVSDFGYAERLGMWGNGTPFANKLRFVGEIQSGGLAAMELVSQDLKANGLYTSRSLSYDDVTYDRLEHVLTADQREMYDEMAKGWQIALQHLEHIMQVTGADKNGGAKSSARSLFWGTHQRFYEQVLTSLQMPTVIKAMEKDLAAGHSVVIQLTKTNAAQQDRQIKIKKQEGGDLDDLDLTPREGFLSYIEHGFPTQEFQEYTDENGNVRSQPVFDSNGAPVQNKEAVEMKEELLRKLGSLRTPENPLDLIINTFGDKTVAEVTGRKQRLVRGIDRNGKPTSTHQTGRTKTVRNKEAAEFMDDKRQILVFSDAGWTGQSYHADLAAKNQRRRMHYVIQPGWRADAAMQGLGRTHRTNQASAPHYVLVSTDLKGHKRFISTIARRLAQLGALTRGQRQTSSQGLFSEADNLENAYAASSLEAFFRALKRGDIKGHGWQDLTEKLGLNNLLDKNGNIIQDKLPDVPQFLNRILSLEYDDQNAVFDAFLDRMEAAIEMAKANGNFDSGMENYRADSITKQTEQVVYENPETKAKTRLITFEAKHRLEFHEYKGLKERQKFHGFVIGQKTGKIYAALKGGYQHTNKDGKVEEQVKLLEPDVDKVRMVGIDTFTRNYRAVTGKDAEKAWKDAIEKSPKTRNETLHILSGAMLGIWDRIGGSTRVYRVTTDDGTRTVGRVIDEEALRPTLERLGVKADKEAAPSLEKALDAIENGGTVELANGWKLGTRRVNGEDRIEIMGYGVYGFREELKGYGAFVESIRYEPRVFIPTENPKPIIEKIVKHRPILRITGNGPDKGPGGGGSGPSFQRREGNPRLGASEMRAVAGRIDAGDTKIVVSSFDALPNRIKEEAAKLGAPAEEIRAVYDQGAVYLVEDRFESEADAEEAVFHELYHKWIAGHLGSSMQDDLNALFDRMGGPEALLTLADRYQWKEARAVMQSYAKRTDLSRREKTAAVVNELLAEMGSRSINPTALQKIKAFIGAIRQWLRDHGLAALSKITESDLLHLLERARSKHGELKAQGNRPYFQSTAAHPTFYSQAALVVERKMPNKASADQVRGILSPNNGIKPDEMKWLGLDDYLRTKDTFTKQDVLDFINQNEVQIKEVMKADIGHRGLSPKEEGRLTVLRAMNDMGRLDNGADQAEWLALEEKANRVGDTKFSQYQLPGGQNYRELLLTLPIDQNAAHEAKSARIKELIARRDELKKDVDRFRAQGLVADVERQLHNTEMQIDMAMREPAEKNAPTFRSSHFSEPNILAHVRFNDRTVDGQKVLFLEEVQSDWHQKGRKAGYDNRTEILKKLEAQGIRREPGSAYGFLNSDGKYVAHPNPNMYPEHAIEGTTEQQDLISDYFAKDHAVPDAPFKKTWHELALKRMLRYAAEHGYDSLAWTTGEQQAERYDLSKMVESVEYGDGYLRVKTHAQRGGTRDYINKSNISPDEVADYIGKEAADRLLNSPKIKVGQSGDEIIYKQKIEGGDLAVGGEGMKGFYDKILPDFLNKYGKKWGAKVQPLDMGGVNMDASPRFDPDTGKDVYPSLEVHALPITDAMKASVMTEGQPLFQRQAADTQTDLPTISTQADVPATIRGSQGSLLQTQGEIAYELPAMSKMDDVIRTLQDKNIDLARLVDTIKATGKTVADDLNPVLKEELYLGRVSKLNQDFITDELRPLVDAMRLNKISLAQMDEYLYARHAKEANAHLKEINPDREDNDALSGMTDEEADRILDDNASPALERLAARVDAILEKTRAQLVAYGLESQETVDAWRDAYDFYVPLHREGYEDGTPGTGQGRSVRGSHSKARTGSNLKATNILANIATDREKAIVRGEKMRPVIALAGLLQENPNSDIATLAKPAPIIYTDPDTGLLTQAAGDIGEYRVPMVKGINKQTGLVEWRPDPTYKGRDNVVNFRLNGVDHAIVFNEHNDRAVQMARALKDLDVGQLNTILATVAPATRHLAAINTQYNPVFGVVNFIRDVQFAMLTLSTTPLANKRQEVLSATRKAIRGIYQDARAIRRGEHPSSAVAQLWERFQRVGGPTGYRDLFRSSNDRAAAIEHMLDPDWWTKTLGGKIVTLGGRLTGVETALVDKAARPVFEWLSDYNQAMENAVRLGVFQTAIDSGMSDEQAASLAKNITVNFNKKGQITTQLGALYAFFNASVQGTARIAETLFEKGKFGVLTETGKTIIKGGVLIGAMQAFALSMAGFDDGEPPEWLKARSLIIPVPGTDKGYISIPMPLGFNVLPSLGRLATESLIYGKPVDRVYRFVGTVMDAFSPVGGASSIGQLLAPTATDPFVALSENRDWAGRQIYREDFNKLQPTPGMSRAKDTSTPWARGLAEAINWATGGTEYQPGHFSPSPDAIDYLIEQATGGVGRELSKASQVASGLATGDEIPMHKVPLLGRLVGSASDTGATRNQFYDNLRTINLHEAEVKGRRRNQEDPSSYVAEHPEARLADYANQVEREVSTLNRRRRDLVRRGASAEQLRVLDMHISARMERFNQRVKQLQGE